MSSFATRKSCPIPGNKRVLRLSCFLLLIAIASVAQAERLPLKAYTVEDGLANSAVNKIVRDSRGFLWFCTADGLSRFDGYTFTNYGTDQGLPHGYVNDLLETRKGEFGSRQVTGWCGLIQRVSPRIARAPSAVDP